MKKLLQLSFLTALSFLCTLHLHGQCNPVTCTTPIPSVNAQDACILPSPDALNCYVGETTTESPVSFPPTWCYTIENNHLLGFVADSVEVTLSISCIGCTFGNAIQAAILQSDDCINMSFVSTCLGNIPAGTSQLLKASGLIPGEEYYLMIDGSAGALCQYSINGLVCAINGPVTACVPGPALTYTSNANATWSIFPPDAGFIAGSNQGNSIEVVWAQTGMAEVCVDSVTCPNAPENCLKVHVGEAVYTTDTVLLCAGNTVGCAGVTFGCEGTFPVTLTSSLGCDSVVNCVVTILPANAPDTTTLPPAFICAEGGYHKLVSGLYVTQPGTYSTVFPSALLCTDSIVLETVAFAPAIVKDYGDVLLCPDACFPVCSDTFCTPGIQQAKCTNSPFCDSTVQFNAVPLVLPQRGVVYADTNANGFRDVQESGIPGVVVFTSTGLTDTTDALGAYAFDVLNTGDTLFLMPQPGDTTLNFVVYDASQPVCYDLDTTGSSEMVSSEQHLLSDEHFYVHPNPAHDRLFIQWTTPAKAGDHLQLYDAQGRLMKTQRVAAQTQAMEWSIGGMPAGVYMVVLHIEKGALRKLLVVQ
jgi:hypothetical protein